MNAVEGIVMHEFYAKLLYTDSKYAYRLLSTQTIAVLKTLLRQYNTLILISKNKNFLNILN